MEASILIHFALGNLASFYSGEGYLQSNINSALYASGYALPELVSQYTGSKCIASIAWQSGLLAAKLILMVRRLVIMKY